MKSRKYWIRFKVGKRFGRKSAYSLRDIAVSVVDRHSLTDLELNRIADLSVTEIFENEDMCIGVRK